MRQNASGQVRPTHPNGPTAGPSLPAQLPSRSPVVRPPCPAQPLANGPFLASPSSGPRTGPHPPSVGNNHTPGTGTNGDVPYLHPNALPHNCTSLGDVWKSQHHNSTQVGPHLILLHCVCLFGYLFIYFFFIIIVKSLTMNLSLSLYRGFRKVRIGQVLMETGLSLPAVRPTVALTIRLDIPPRPLLTPPSLSSITFPRPRPILPPLPLPPPYTQLPQVPP